MNWKNRLTNYNFWVSIVSAVLLILQALKIKVDFIYVNEVSTAILGLLVVIGIINDPTKSNKTSVKVLKDESKTDEENVNNSSTPYSQKTEQTNEAASETIKENEEKFFENDKIEAKNAKIFENLSENLQNTKIFEENLKEEKVSDSAEKLDDAQQNIPSNDKDEIFDSTVQTNISFDEVEKNEPLKIVN